jgi:hypothetical protein
MPGDVKQARKPESSARQFRSPIPQPAETLSVSHLPFNRSLKFFPLGVCFG